MRHIFRQLEALASELPTDLSALEYAVLADATTKLELLCDDVRAARVDPHARTMPAPACVGEFRS
jgi:hypothetical protein